MPFLPRKLPPLLAFVLALFVGLAASCYSPTYHIAELPDQSVPLTDPALCRFYVLRPSQGRWNLRRVLVYDGEREIGSIHEGEYLCWERPPGESTLTVVYDGPKDEGGYMYTLFELDAPAGAVAYYGVSLGEEQHLPIVSAMDPAAAREELAKRLPAQPLDTLGVRN